MNECERIEHKNSTYSPSPAQNPPSSLKMPDLSQNSNRFLETLIRTNASTHCFKSNWITATILCTLSFIQIIAQLPYLQSSQFTRESYASKPFHRLSNPMFVILNPQFFLFDSISLQPNSSAAATATTATPQTIEQSVNSRILIQANQSRHLETNSSLYYDINQYSYLKQSDFGFVNSTTTSTSTSNSDFLATTIENTRISQKINNQILLQLIILSAFTLFISSIFLLQEKGNRGIVIFYRNGFTFQKRLAKSIKLIALIYNNIFLIPLVELSLIGSTFTTAYDNHITSQRFAASLCIINTLCCISFSFILSIYCEQSINASNNQFSRFHRSTLHMSSLVIKLCITFNFSLNLIEDSLQIIQNLLTLAFFILSIVDVSLNFAYSNFHLSRSSLIGSLLGFMFTLIFQISTFFDFDCFNEQIMVLIMSVLVSKLGYELHSARIQNILLSFSEENSAFEKESTQTLRKKILRLSMLISFMNEGNLQENSNTQGIIISLLSQHLNRCVLATCFCKKYETCLIFSKESISSQKFDILLVREFLSKFILSSIETCIKQIKLQNNSNNHILLIQLISLLSEIGYCTRAISLLFNFRLSIHKTNKANRNFTFSSFDDFSSHCLQLSLKSQLLDVLSGTSSTQQVEVSKQSTIFIQTIEEKIALKNSFIACIKSKLAFYNSILQGDFQSHTNIIRDSHRISLELDALEKRVLSLYASFESQRVQRLLVFFYAELRNDMYKANTFAKQTLPLDQSLMRILEKSKIDLSSKKLCYFKVSFGKQKGKVIGISSNAPEILGINRQKLNQIENITDLIPPPISRSHTAIVAKFFEEGVSSAFRQLGNTFYKDLLGYAHPITSYFDVCTNDYSDFSFIIFMKPVPLQGGSNDILLLFNEHGILESCTPNTQKVLLEIESIIPFNQSVLRGLKWTALIPQIDAYLKELNQMNQHTKEFMSVEIIFNLLKISSRFTSNLKIVKKTVGFDTYYTITLSNIQKDTCDIESDDQAFEKLTEIAQERIDSQYEKLQFAPLDDDNGYDMQDKVFQSDMQNHRFKEFEKDEYVFSESNLPPNNKESQSPAFYSYQHSQKYNNNNTEDQSMPTLSKQQIHVSRSPIMTSMTSPNGGTYTQQSSLFFTNSKQKQRIHPIKQRTLTPQSECVTQVMLSNNRITSPRLTSQPDCKQLLESTEQEDYENSKMSSPKMEFTYRQKVKASQLHLDPILEQDRRQLPIEEQEEKNQNILGMRRQSSSIGIESIKVQMARYKALSQFVNSKKQPKNLLLFMLVRLFTLILVTTLTAVFLLSINYQINTLQDNTQVLRFQSELLSPSDIFSSVSWQASAFTYLLAYRAITPQMFLKEIMFIKDIQIYEYDMLSKFVHGMYSYNQKLQDFLNQESELFVSNFHKGKTNAKVTHRNIVLQMTSYYFDVLNYSWGTYLETIDRFNPKFMFNISNALTISKILNNISSITYQDLSEGTQSFQDGIYLQIIIISLTTLSLTSISLFLIIRFFNLLQRLQNLFLQCDRLWIEEEIARNVSLVSFLQKTTSIDPFQNYSFSIKQQEEYLDIIELKKQATLKKYKAQRKSNDLGIKVPPSYNKLITIIIFFSVILSNIGCFVFVLIQNNSFIDSFLVLSNRYQNFSNFYSAPSRLQLLREQAYSASSGIMPYYNLTDTLELAEEINLRASLLLEFVTSEIMKIDQPTIENNASADMVEYQDFIRYSNQANLCEHVMHLQGDYLSDCLRVNNGILQKGLTASLMNLINEFKTESKETKFLIQFRNPKFPNGNSLKTSLYVARILRYSSDLLYGALQNICTKSWNTILIVMLLYSFVIFGANFYYLFLRQLAFQNTFTLSKKSILLLPMIITSRDNSFASTIRVISSKFSLIDQ